MSEENVYPDVYGCTCRKLNGETGTEISFFIWALVTALRQSGHLSSTQIMEFLEISPLPEQLLADLRQFRLENPMDHNSSVSYVINVLENK